MMVSLVTAIGGKHGYPGHRRTRRPVPAEDWNEMNLRYEP